MTSNPAIRCSALSVFAAALICVPACGKRGGGTIPAPASPTGANVTAPVETPAPDAVYTVRAIVVSLPDPANPTSEFRLHHEPIPTFKTPDGRVVGMHEMEMPFPVDNPALLEGIKIGDAVEITFADWYRPVRKYKVTKVVKLPEGTKLDLQDK